MILIGYKAMLSFISVWRGKTNTIQISKNLALKGKKLHNPDIMQHDNYSPFYLKLFFEEYQECFLIGLPLYSN